MAHLGSVKWKIEPIFVAFSENLNFNKAFDHGVIKLLMKPRNVRVTTSVISIMNNYKLVVVV